MITLTIGMIMGMLGLVVDIGWMHFIRESEQSAADAGAMAAVEAANAAAVYTCDSAGCQSSFTDCSSVSASTSLYRACQYAQTNGYSSGGLNGKQTVQVKAAINSTPTGVTSVTAKYWVTVKITQVVPQLFSAVLGNFTGMVAASATAMVGPTGASACVYVLDPSGSSAMYVTGQGTLNATCGVQVTSTSNTAINVSGNSHLVGGAITIGGNYSSTGQSTVTGSPILTNQGVNCCGDPLASLPVPSDITNKSDCTVTGQYYSDQNKNNNVTLTPGVYCGGIMINGGTVTFSPGTYVLNGGGLTIQNSSTVTGTGVTFVDTAYRTADGAYTGTYGGLTLSDSIVNVNLSAPTSGAMEGILFYQDPSIPVGSAASKIQAKSSTTLQGSIYLPTTSLTYTGEASTSGVIGLVVYDLTLNGSSSLTLVADSTGTKTGLGGGTLVTMVQ